MYILSATRDKRTSSSCMAGTQFKWERGCFVPRVPHELHISHVRMTVCRASGSCLSPLMWHGLSHKSTALFSIQEHSILPPDRTKADRTGQLIQSLQHKWMKCDLESVKVWKLELWFYLHSVASCLSKLDQVSTHFIEAVNLEQISGNIYAI